MSKRTTAKEASHLGNGLVQRMTSEDDSGVSLAEELQILREENAALRRRNDDLERQLVSAKQAGDDRFAERQREFQRMIEEKSELIRALHEKNTELRDRAAQSSSHFADGKESKNPERRELAKLQGQLEEKRRQIEEDEESMMIQLRDMEMALAKDRAEMARQRVEVERLQTELKREVETARRDSGLRERLNSLRRGRRSAKARTTVNQNTPLSTPLPKIPTDAASSGTKSGIFRRLFGGGQ